MLTQESCRLLLLAPCTEAGRVRTGCQGCGQGALGAGSVTTVTAWCLPAPRCRLRRRVQAERRREALQPAGWGLLPRCSQECHPRCPSREQCWGRGSAVPQRQQPWPRWQVQLAGASPSS